MGSEVTVLEAEETVLPGQEPEVLEEIRRCLSQEGIEKETGAKAEEMRESAGSKDLT